MTLVSVSVVPIAQFVCLRQGHDALINLKQMNGFLWNCDILSPGPHIGGGVGKQRSICC